MKMSFWNQYWVHKERVNQSPEQVYKRLLKYYRQSSKTFILGKENYPSGFSFQRGRVLLSIFAFGSERWLKHYVDIYITEIKPNETDIRWSIELKLCGLQAGKNAIIEECKRLARPLE
ncbi:MAG: hypothetical protein VB068_05555 [Petrimonas sp.]|nr:hypothetical protein [Petrimonas sp.]MEA5114786.1 hypothetical protein [Geobacteraceae bacterium]